MVKLVTARVRSTREGTVFTGVCLFTFRGGGTYLPDGGGGVPTQVWMVGGGVPSLARVGGYLPMAGVGGGTYLWPGWGGTYLWPGLGGTYLGRGVPTLTGGGGGYALPLPRVGTPPARVGTPHLQ